MKKILSLVMTSVLAIGVLAGCGTKAPVTPVETKTETPEETKVETPVVEEKGAIAKMGLGIVTTIDKSKDYAEEKAVGQVDSVIVAAGFDKDGKIVSVTIDTAQSKVEFAKDMVLKTDVAVEGKTKVELGADYGMKETSTLKKEWFEQIAELEKYMTGKTVAEVKAMKLTETTVPDVEELKTLVTIKVSGYIAALEKAYASAIEVKGAETVGLGHGISLAKSKSMEGETMAVAQVDTTIVATALNADGKVAGTIIDTAQTKVSFDKDGKVTNDLKAAVKSKVELGNDYGMKKASTIGKEWFEQAKALADWTIGKTPAEVEGLKVTEGKADVEELKTTVSVSVGGYIAAFKEAASKVK
jgi:lysine/ornithine N-monooxygenase